MQQEKINEFIIKKLKAESKLLEEFSHTLTELSKKSRKLSENLSKIVSNVERSIENDPDIEEFLKTNCPDIWYNATHDSMIFDISLNEFQSVKERESGLNLIINFSEISKI